MEPQKAALINGLLLAVLSLPCVLGFNVWSHVQLGGRGVLDMEDFAVSNLLLPIGSLVYLLFCVTKWGWGFDKYLAEANRGSGLKLSPQAQALFPVGAAGADSADSGAGTAWLKLEE